MMLLVQFRRQQKQVPLPFILVLANIGNFVSPYGHRLLERFGIGSDALQNILSMGILMTVLGILFFSLLLKRSHSQNEV